MKIKKVLKITIPALILAFLVFTVLKDWDAVYTQLMSSEPVFIIFTVGVLVLTFVGGAFFWQNVLSLLNQRLTFKESLRIFTLANFGRFIPGVFLHYIARVYMAKKAGINLASSTASVVLEAYYTFCGAAMISIFGISFIVTRFKWPVLYLYLYLLLLVLIIVINPKFVFKIIKKVPLLKSKVSSLSFDIDHPDHLKLLLLSSILFFLNGLAFYFLTLAFKNEGFSLLELSGLFSSSWMVGFLTPVAPGGLGVSDLSFSYLLSSGYGFGVATMLVLIYRVALIISEFLVFLAVIWLSGLSVLEKKIES